MINNIKYYGMKPKIVSLVAGSLKRWKPIPILPFFFYKYVEVSCSDSMVLESLKLNVYIIKDFIMTVVLLILIAIYKLAKCSFCYYVYFKIELKSLN